MTATRRSRRRWYWVTAVGAMLATGAVVGTWVGRRTREGRWSAPHRRTTTSRRPDQNISPESGNSCAALEYDVLDAAESGSLSRLRDLLLRGADAKMVEGRTKWTGLHWAAYRGDEAVAELLLTHGADVNARTAEVYDPPDASAGEGPLSALKTPLFAAAAGGNAGMTRLLLDHRADPKARGNWGDTALHRAAAEGESEVAKLLLARGAEVDARTKSGETPLHWAITNHGQRHFWLWSHPDSLGTERKVDSNSAVGFLLSHGANPNARDKDGFTPLHWAAAKGHTRLAELLLRNGADPSATLKEAHVEHHRMDDDVIGAAGQGVLHLAAAAGDVELVGKMVARGVSVDLRDHTGVTPLDEACRRGREGAVRCLLDHGASVTTTDKAGWTPLHYAVFGGRGKVTELLLERGAPVDARTIRPLRIQVATGYGYRSWRDVPGGQTALQLDRACGNLEIEKALLVHGAGDARMTRSKKTLVAE